MTDEDQQTVVNCLRNACGVWSCIKDILGVGKSFLECLLNYENWTQKQLISHHMGVLRDFPRA